MLILYKIFIVLVIIQSSLKDKSFVECKIRNDKSSELPEAALRNLDENENTSLVLSDFEGTEILLLVFHTGSSLKIFMYCAIVLCEGHFHIHKIFWKCRRIL
jgi:hypothetical protein